MVPLRSLRRRSGLSERALAEACDVARGSVRALDRSGNTTIGTFGKVARALGCEVTIALHTSAPCDSVASSVAVAARTAADGPRSWRVHFMELVDGFRRTLDPRLLLLPPPPGLPAELHALLASVVLALCWEAGIDPPSWARVRRFLPRPFFPSETESLKASALVESPLAFRRNNIYVLDNFLERA